MDVEQPHDEVTSQMPMGAALAGESGVTSIADLVEPPGRLAANGR